jgi:hypothetical protein
MSLYRSPARRSSRAIAIALVVGIVTGSIAGYLGGTSGQEPASLRKGLQHAQDTIRPAVDGISVVAVSYGTGVKDGKVVAPGQLQGAKDQLARVEASFTDARADLAVLDPDGAAKVATDLDQLGAKLDALAPVAEVEALATSIEGELRTLARLS